jgi:hypothetical protein
MGSFSSIAMVTASLVLEGLQPVNWCEPCRAILVDSYWWERNLPFFFQKNTYPEKRP